MKINILFFVLVLRGALAFLGIDNQISSPGSKYGNIYPVYDMNYNLLVNDRFCLGFSALSRTRVYFGIFINWKADAELVWSPDVKLDLGSRLFTNGSLILQNSRQETVWLVEGVKGYNLTDQGNLVLYNENNTTAWQSWDHPTGTALFGQPFKNLSGMIFLNDSVLNVRYGRCEFSVQKSGIESAELSSNCIASELSGIMCFTFRDIIGNQVFSIQLLNLATNQSLSTSFLRLNVIGFSIYILQDSSWSVQFVDLSQQRNSSNYTCPTGDVPWSRRSIISIESLLSALLLMLLYSEVLYFLSKSKPHQKLALLLLSSFITSSVAIALLTAQERWIVSFYENPKYPTLSGSTDILMRHIINITLCCIFKTSKRSEKLLLALIIFNMLTLLSTHLGIITLHFYKTSFHGYAFGYFVSPSFLAAANTICLIVLKLPGPKWCSSELVRLALVLTVNSGTAFLSSLLTLGLGDNYRANPISPIRQKIPDDAFWICLLVVNMILMLVLVWACYSHQIITKQRIVAMIQSILTVKNSVQVWCSIQKKRVLVCIISCLLGRPHPETDTEDEITMSLSSYSYEELEVVTNQFSKLIGRGGFGGVYKGMLLDGKKVAVKKLESTTQGKREFKAEIEILGRIHHVNLAGLLGFCAEGLHRLLVYELMANGSLDRWIFDDGPYVDWQTRMKILVGTARGLAYLHEECDPRIIHLDVKPQNILLDEFFNAKVSDFGLCRFLSRDASCLIMTRMMGTMGYLAPEWVHNTVTEKSDVYSFGIVVLEVVSGTRNYRCNDQSFRSWAIERIYEKSLLDPRLANGTDETEIRRVIEVALSCTENDPNMRPAMGRVLKLLEGGNDLSCSITSEEVAMLPHDHVMSFSMT